jgi:hypothetical protein
MHSCASFLNWRTGGKRNVSARIAASSRSGGAAHAWSSASKLLGEANSCIDITGSRPPGRGASTRPRTDPYPAVDRWRRAFLDAAGPG